MSSIKVLGVEIDMEATDRALAATDAKRALYHLENLTGAEKRRVLELIHGLDGKEFIRLTGRRLVRLTTKASLAYTAFRYLPGDILLVGRESAGAPAAVHAAADARVLIPLKPPMTDAIVECRHRRSNGRRRSHAAARRKSF